MVPLILAGAAAAVLLTGCAHEGETAPPQSPEGNSPPDPDDAEKNYQILFKPDSLAGESYETLRRAGMQLKALDRGCHTIDFTKAEPNGTQRNLKGQIESCEVYEYILDHPKEFRALGERLAGGTLPWELDDHNSATDFDAKVRTRVQNAITPLKSILAEQGLKADSPEYREKLAVALYYFAVYPVDPTEDPGVKNWQHYGKKELYSMGLGKFHEEILLKIGGLGRMTVKGINLAQEYSALQTIEKNDGWCTEWSKVLYGVYHMAGLNPFFATTRIDPKTIAAELSVNPDEQILDHIFLGLPLGSRTRFFDVSRYNPDIKYSRYYRYHLLHYLSDDFSNRGVDEAKNHENFSKAAVHLQRSLELNPDNYLSNYNLGVVLANQGQVEVAVRYLEKAVKVDPAYLPAYEALGGAYSEQNQHDKAIQNYLQAVNLSPGETEPLVNLGVVFLKAKKTQEALEVFRKVLKLDPNNAEAYDGMGGVYFYKENYMEAEKNFKEALRLDPKLVRAYLNLSLVYFVNHQDAEARQAIQKALELDPGNEHARKLLQKFKSP